MGCEREKREGESFSLRCFSEMQQNHFSNTATIAASPLDCVVCSVGGLVEQRAPIAIEHVGGALAPRAAPLAADERRQKVELERDNALAQHVGQHVERPVAHNVQVRVVEVAADVEARHAAQQRLAHSHRLAVVVQIVDRLEQRKLQTENNETKQEIRKQESKIRIRKTKESILKCCVSFLFERKQNDDTQLYCQTLRCQRKALVCVAQRSPPKHEDEKQAQ